MKTNKSSKKTLKKKAGVITKKVVKKTPGASKKTKKTAFGGGPKDLSKLPVGLANYWRRQRGEKEVKIPEKKEKIEKPKESNKIKAKTIKKEKK